MNRMEKVVAILQARTSSNRLPGKVLRPLLGQPMIQRQIERLRRAKNISRLVLATSVDPSDDELAAFAASIGVDVVRGSLDDVLSRFMTAVARFPAETYVRLTGDCPLTDPAVIDRLIEKHRASGADYASNCETPTFPDGLDAEVMTADALKRADREAKQAADREHVTLYIRQHPQAFRLENMESGRALGDERWTVDTKEDLAFVEAVYQRLYAGNPAFGMEDVLRCLEKEPNLREINSGHARNEGLMKSLRKDELAKRYQKSVEWLARAEASIPLGSQTFSKSRTHYPMGVSPYFIQKAKGARAWDLDGNEYVDFVSSLCSVNLGYADADVNDAVKNQLDEGVIFSLPHPLETLVAEKMKEMIPCAEKVRFGKNGSDATAGAIRVARAATGRDHVLVCGYHGWQDWYIGSTARNKGVPAATRSLTHSIPYNDLDAARKALEERRGQVAALILEPMNVFWPKKGYLEGLRELTREHGVVLVFDETITGFRYAKGGAQELFGVTPDLATFGKGLANGFPLSAVAGRADLMKEMEEIFFSFTFGGETASLSAALATMEKIQKQPVIETMTSQGKRILEGLDGLIKKHGCGDFLETGGHPTWSFFIVKDKAPYTAWQIKTLYFQEMFARGVLTVGSHNLSYSHGDAEVAHLLKAYDEVLPILRSAVLENKLETLLVCKPLEPLFKVR